MLGGGALGGGQRAVRQRDPDRLREAPLARLDLELGAERADLGPRGVGRLGKVLFQRVIVVALVARVSRVGASSNLERLTIC